jgi:FtsP/CotA-like multicopper oxidase with cupredoxin domain
MHIHEITFEVMNREPITFAVDEAGGISEVALAGDPRGAEAWETGFKDTVIAYPDEVTRVRAKFDHAGQFVWHCHIVEHEDNEMMRPYRIGPVQPGEPGAM